jgi:Domain of unknown function (DUF1707)
MSATRAGRAPGQLRAAPPRPRGASHGLPGSAAALQYVAMTGELSPADPGELRASHEDRDRVAEQLRIAAGDGRLTAAELDERLELALSARTYRELSALVADLPVAAGHGSADLLPAPGAGPLQPKELIRIQCGSGHAKRDGRWVVPQRMEVSVTSGRVKLDFRDAVITGRTLRIDASVRSGHLTLITRPGIAVDADDVSVRSGRVRVRPWPGPRAPEILRIEVAGKVGSGGFHARPPHRTFWQWLRRAQLTFQPPARQLP